MDGHTPESVTAPGAGSARTPPLAAENVRLRAENDQLHRALHSRPEIDQAQGIVMALGKCPSESAWQALVEVSQHTNTKLREVAGALVATTATGCPLPREIRRELRCALDRLRSAPGSRRGNGRCRH